MPQTPTSRLSELATELADLASRCAPSLVAIRLRAARSVSAIVWRSGYLVTAAEPLDEGATSLRVIADSGSEHQAKVLGRDASTDVALLRVEGLPGRELTAGDPASLRVGQLALVLGRSAEHGPIASFGSIAVAGAAWQSQLGGRIDRLIRLGVTLTAAGEGAAVLDAEGRLLGMAVHGPGRTVLAIPAPTIGRVVEQLLAKGRISRGYLGIAMQAVQLPRALKELANAEVGLLVSNVDGGSAAEAGGILLGDVIVAWNGAPLRDYRQVQRLLGPESVGSSVDLAVVRGGTPMDVRLTVRERPDLG
jgi:serine protease DegQ